MQVRWIDDGFYSAICSAKDASATFISILTSVINFIVQSVAAKPVSYMEMGAQKVDSNFEAMFTMVVTSLNNLLNQVALMMFYPFLAMQKVAVCQTSSVMALVENAGFKITIGVPEIQVSHRPGLSTPPPPHRLQTRIPPEIWT